MLAETQSGPEQQELSLNLHSETMIPQRNEVTNTSESIFCQGPPMNFSCQAVV